MSDFSATFAPNKCVLANTSGTNIWIGCCENGKKARRRAEKARRQRARNTPCKNCDCSAGASAAGKCGC